MISFECNPLMYNVVSYVSLHKTTCFEITGFEWILHTLIQTCTEYTTICVRSCDLTDMGYDGVPFESNYFPFISYIKAFDYMIHVSDYEHSFYCPWYVKDFSNIMNKEESFNECFRQRKKLKEKSSSKRISRNWLECFLTAIHL